MKLQRRKIAYTLCVFVGCWLAVMASAEAAMPWFAACVVIACMD